MICRAWINADEIFLGDSWAWKRGNGRRGPDCFRG
jgi:hypothetical protein